MPSISSFLKATWTPINSRLGWKFDQVGARTGELAALERLENLYRLIMGECCDHSSAFNFEWISFITPQTLFMVGKLFSHCPSVCACVGPSVTFCYLNILKSHGWIFIIPCKHVHICKTNTLNKK